MARITTESNSLVEVFTDLYGHPLLTDGNPNFVRLQKEFLAAQEAMRTNSALGNLVDRTIGCVAYKPDFWYMRQVIIDAAYYDSARKQIGYTGNVDPDSNEFKERYFAASRDIARRNHQTVGTAFEVGALAISGGRSAAGFASRTGIRWAERSAAKKLAPKGLDIDGMTPLEAARYREFFQRNSPAHVTPATRQTSRIQLSSDGYTTYQIDDFYDEFGRLRGSTPYDSSRSAWACTP